MTTSTEARDAINGAINDAWLASGVTSGFEMQWQDVTRDPVDEDANGLPVTYARAFIFTQISPQETLGGVGSRKHLTEGLLLVQVFTPAGDGYGLADQISEVLKAAVRNVRIGTLWFFDAVPTEKGKDGAHTRTDFTAKFRYEELS